MILEKINLKNQKLETKIKPSFTKPILSDSNFLGYLANFIENTSLIRQAKLAITLRLFAKSFIFLKYFLKWGSKATSNLIPHIQKHAFVKMILLKIMKTIAKNVILN